MLYPIFPIPDIFHFLLLALLTLPFGLYISLCVHEFGHAIAGYYFEAQVDEIDSWCRGKNDALISFTTHKTQINFGLNLMAGGRCLIETTRLNNKQKMLVYAAGSLAEILVIGPLALLHPVFIPIGLSVTAAALINMLPLYPKNDGHYFWYFFKEEMNGLQD